MAERTGFSSAIEVIVFSMRNLAPSGAIRGEDKVTQEEVAAIKARLERVGYL